MNDLRDPRFLIVDDVSARRRVMCALLKEIGFERCATAQDGGVALAMLARAPYDVVVSDTLMPNMDGFQLLAAIKADAALKHLPVLMVTLEGREDDFARAMAGGAAACIVKPFTRVALEQRVREVLARQAAIA
jgi:two-component system chemotaxis response regulator CheY